MKTRRKLIALVVTILVAPGCSTSDSSAPAPKDSASSEAVFLTGTVTRGGEHVEGAQVVATLWPENDDSEVGDLIEMFDVDDAVTRADGSFTLYLDPDDVPTRYFGGDRSYVNFDFRVFDDGEFATWGSTLHPVGSPQTWRTEGGAVAADAPLEMHLDLEKQRITMVDSYGESTSSDLPVGEARRTG